MFKVFREEEADGVLESVEYYSVSDLTPKDSGKVIAEFSNNIPAILEARSGWGRIILYNSSPDTQVSDLPINPAFLPLMQQMVLYLASGIQEVKRDIVLGSFYEQNLITNPDSPPEITDPEDNISKARVSVIEQGNQIQYGPVERTGIYRLEFKSEGIVSRDYFAVNLGSTGESLLKAAKDGEILNKLGERARFVYLDDPSEEMISSIENRSDFSKRLLIAAAILALLEIPLANRRKIETED
jgi:hypothetical protein